MEMKDTFEIEKSLEVVPGHLIYCENHCYLEQKKSNEPDKF